MPLLALLRVCARRWYAVALGVALTLTLLLVVHERPGVYYSQVQLVLVGPAQTSYPNTVAAPPFSLAPTASLLVSDWNGTHRPLVTSSSDTTLYGEGVREGTQVRLPNQGSQFVPLFDAPYVEVQVVGPSEAEVTARAQQAVARLRGLLQQRQDRAGVPARMQITTLLAPADVGASYVPTNSARALAVTLVLGVVGTALLAVGTDRLLARRRRRPGRPAAPRGLGPPAPTSARAVAHQATQVSSL